MSRNSDNERSLERKKDRHSVCSMEPELYNQLRGLQKSARELRQGGQRARQYILLTLLSWYWVIHLWNQNHREASLVNEYLFLDTFIINLGPFH